MKTYLATLVFRIEKAGEQTAQFDEQVRLIHAGTTAEAYEKSLVLAMSEEGPVHNISGQVLQWAFVGITALLELGQAADRAALFSSTRETNMPQQYQAFIHEKQQLLLTSIHQYKHGQLTAGIS